MAEQLLKRFEDLVATGTQLAPLGGFEFSGYNARLQNKYLEWRKSCLELLEQAGPIGFPYKNKVFSDQNGSFFFQSSALLILNAIKELHEKVKASPELAAAPAASPAPASAATAGTVTSAETPGARVLRPPPKKETSQPAAAASSGGATKVYVVGEKTDPLRMQVTDFLNELGLLEVPLDRQHGQMINLEGLAAPEDAKYAIFVINSDDLSYVMFEIGHFVGNLGKGHVCVIHMTDVTFPKNVPGVTIRPIVVKLEEASLSLIKELKALGYKINL